MQQDAHRSRIILDLLNSVERDSMQSQRGRASEFGVAVGLVNAYLKFCIKKGYVKVRRFPARQYSYLLTPKGFAEKSRLAIERLSYSLSFFRGAREGCAAMFEEVETRGWRRVVLAGATEVAEISILCALEKGVAVAGVVDPQRAGEQFMGASCFSSLADVQSSFDGVLVTAIATLNETYAEAVARAGRDRVLLPSLFGLMPPPGAGRS